MINLAAAGTARAGVAQMRPRPRSEGGRRQTRHGAGRARGGKLKNRTKLKGHVAEASDEHFTVVDSDGGAARVAYSDVESVKAVKPKSARKKFDEKGLIGLSLIGGIFALVFLVASQTK